MHKIHIRENVPRILKHFHEERNDSVFNSQFDKERNQENVGLELGTGVLLKPSGTPTGTTGKFESPCYFNAASLRPSLNGCFPVVRGVSQERGRGQ